MQDMGVLQIDEGKLLPVQTARYPESGTGPPFPCGRLSRSPKWTHDGPTEKLNHKEEAVLRNELRSEDIDRPLIYP